MSFLGSLGNFELFNLKGMANQVKDNPARLLYGSADPFSTKVWNKVLGTDDKPLIDQWGGAAEHRYQEAEDAGIDTSAGRTGHNIAKTIASFYAGGYGADKAGGLLGSGGGSATWADGAGKVVGQAPGSGSGAIGGVQSQPGLLSTFGDKLSSANQTMKPYMDAYQMGQQFMPQGQQAPQAQQAPVTAQSMAGGPEALAMLANQGRQAQQTTMQNAASAREARKAQRRGLLG